MSVVTASSRGGWCRLLPDSSKEKDESFEVLDLAEAGKNWLERALDGELSKQSVPVQIGIGAGSGWLTGYLLQKVGKAAASAVGGGLLLVVIGHHTGYLKVNWSRIKKEYGETQIATTRELQKRSPQVQSLFHTVKDLIRKNLILSSGFAGGFLIGVSL